MEKERSKTWNWFAFLYSLAKGDPLKFEEASELNMIFALSLKSYEKIYPSHAQAYLNTTK